MGSSKKHKKREKYKRDRSRSRDRDSSRRSHKSKTSDRSRKVYEDNESYHSKRVSKRDEDFSGDDDLDIDSMLESKRLETEKMPSKVSPNQDHSEVYSGRQRRDSPEMTIKEPMDISHAEAFDKDMEDTFPEEKNEQSHASLSISETNKLRAKLGLKPLAVSEEIPGLGSEQAESAKSEVFVKTENISELQAAAKFREKIQTMKDKRKEMEKLSTVKAIADSESDEESASAWVVKSRKIEHEKEQAEKRAKLLEEMDAEFGLSNLIEEEFHSKKKDAYTSRDLKGIKVLHDTSMFNEGQQVILTIKDKGVLDEDEDVLQNVNLVDEERYARNIEIKKKKKDYQPYEEEYDEFGILKQKDILSKYDEEIHGEQKKSFTIGDISQQEKQKEMEAIRLKLKQQQGVTLEMPNMKLANEYYTPDDMVQFKKPKMKRKVRKMLKADDLLAADAAMEESLRHGRGSHQMETSFRSRGDQDDVVIKEDLSKVLIDEDDAQKELYSALTKTRRLKQKTMINAPEKMAAELQTETSKAKATENVSPSKSGLIVLNATAEFCRSLGDIPTYGMSGNRGEEVDELMEFEKELKEERQKQELEAQNRGAWNEVNINDAPGHMMLRENEPILEEEPDITVGVAGALQLAQKKGYLDKDNKKLGALPRVSQLQAKSYTIEEKFYEDDKFGKRDRCSGPIQDFREKEGYKPDVKLEYIDDGGRLLNSKEAFRYLSHKFHGKGPGKNKVDKRMKKLDQDTKLKQMNSTDTPLNTVKLLQVKQKETQSPFIVLSGGSKALTQAMISKPSHP